MPKITEQQAITIQELKKAQIFFDSWNIRYPERVSIREKIQEGESFTRAIITEAQVWAKQEPNERDRSQEAKNFIDFVSEEVMGKPWASRFAKVYL